MAHNNGLGGMDHRIISGLRTAVGHINKHTHFVHLLHTLLAEHGQPAVVVLLAAAPQCIALGISHAQLADAQAIQDVNAVHLVFNGSSSLDHKHHGDLALFFCGKDIVHGFTMDNKILMGQVTQPHPQIMNDVDPLPTVRTGNNVGAVHHIIEDTVDVGIGQRLISAAITASPHGVKQRFTGGHIPCGKVRMIVEADVGRPFQQFPAPDLFFRIQGQDVSAGPVPVRPVNDLKIPSRLKILIRLIGAKYSR